MNTTGTVKLLSDSEIDQVSGGIPVLVVWALWTGGGALVGAGGAALVHYFGNGNHEHK